MSESTLSVTYEELKQAVAHYLGLSLSSDDWSDEEAAIIDLIIKRGLRQFYKPPKVYDGELPHRWSFLTHIDSVTTELDKGDYDLPDDFGGIDSHYMTYQAGRRPDVRIVSEGEIRRMRQLSSTRQAPMLAAIRPKGTAVFQDAGQRFEIIFYPIPNGEYTIRYNKIVQVNALDKDHRYPLGGMAYGDCIMKSCLAAAETTENEGRGPKWDDFMAALTSAIREDQTTMAPQNLGYNGDNSDMRYAEGPGRPVRHTDSGVIAVYKGNI
jgi:hypothetical protein